MAFDNADKFQNFTREDIEAIPSNVCNLLHDLHTAWMSSTGD